MQDKMRSNVKKSSTERLAAEEELMAAAGALGRARAPAANSTPKKPAPKPNGFRDTARQRIHDDNTDSASVTDARQRMARSRSGEREVADLDVHDSIRAGMTAGPRRRGAGGDMSQEDASSPPGPQRYGGKLNIPETAAQRSARLMQSLSSIEATLASVKREFKRPPTMQSQPRVHDVSPAAAPRGRPPRASPPRSRPDPPPQTPLLQFVSARTQEEATRRDDATTSTTSAARMYELEAAARKGGPPAADHLTGIELASEQIRALRAELLLAIQRHKEAEQAANDTRSSLLQERQELQSQVGITVAASRDAKARFDEAVVTLRAANRDLASTAENERTKRVAMTEQLADMQRNAAAIQSRLAGQQASAASAREAADLVAAIAGITPPMETGRVANQLQGLRVQVSELSAALDLTRRQRDGISDTLHSTSAALNASPDASLVQTAVIPAIRSQVIQLNAPVDAASLWQRLPADGDTAEDAAADANADVGSALSALPAGLQQGADDDAAKLGLWLRSLQTASAERDERVARAVQLQASSAFAARAAAAAQAAHSAAAIQEQELQRTKQQLSTTTQALAAAREQMQATAQERDSLARQQASAEALSRSNATKVKFLEKQLQDMRSTATDAASQDKLRAAQRRAQEAQAALSGAQSENKHLASQLASLKIQLAQGGASSDDTADLGEVTSADQAAVAQLKQELAKAKAAAAQVAKRQAQANQADAAITESFKKQLMQARAEIEQLQAAAAQVTKRQAQANQADAAITESFKKQLMQARAEIEQLQAAAAQVAKRQAQANQADAAITESFKKQLMQARAEIEKLRGQLAKAGAPHHQAPSAAAGATADAGSSAAQVRDLQTEVQALRQRLSAVSATAADAQRRVSKVAGHVAQAANTGGHTVKQTAPTALSTTPKAAAASPTTSALPSNAAAQDKLASSAEEAEELRSQLAYAQDKLASSAEEAEELRSQLAYAQDKLASSAEEAEELRSQLATAAQRANDLTGRASALQASAHAAAVSASQMNGERDEAQGRVRQLEEQLRAAQEEAAAAAAAARSSSGMHKKLKVARSSMATAQASLTASQGTIVALVEKVMALQAAARGALPPPDTEAPPVGGGMPAAVYAGHADSVLQTAGMSAPREALLAVRGLAAQTGTDRVRVLQVQPGVRVDKAAASDMATAVHSVASYRHPVEQ